MTADEVTRAPVRVLPCPFCGGAGHRSAHEHERGIAVVLVLGRSRAVAVAVAQRSARIVS